MKGLHTFKSQSEAVKYYTLLVSHAASSGDFGEKVMLTLRHQVEQNMPMVDGYRKEYWEGTCLPVLFFIGAIEASMRGAPGCFYTHSVEAVPEGDENTVLVGQANWYGQHTRGRFVIIIFAEDGSAKMYYDLGYRQGKEVKTSSFLHLPKEGDEDWSGMRDDLFKWTAESAAGLTAEPAPEPPIRPAALPVSSKSDGECELTPYLSLECLEELMSPEEEDVKEGGGK